MPTSDQDVVLAYLLDRALLPADADVTPGPSAPVRFSSSSHPGQFVSPPWNYWVGSLVLGRLAEGESVEELARELAVDERAIRLVLGDLTERRHLPDELRGIFRLLAAGKSLPEAAGELGLSETDVARALQPSDQLASAVCAALSTRAALPNPASVYFAAGGQGTLRTMPVRFPEEQYQRLKNWCAAHNFPMAVVVRGLVERFLDEREQRSA